MVVDNLISQMFDDNTVLNQIKSISFWLRPSLKIIDITIKIAILSAN